MNEFCPISYTLDTGEGTRIVVCNHINGVPLNSWWSFEVMAEEVEGTLTDPLQNGMRGPFQTSQDAFRTLDVLPGRLPFKVDNPTSPG